MEELGAAGVVLHQDSHYNLNTTFHSALWILQHEVVQKWSILLLVAGTCAAAGWLGLRPSTGIRRQPGLKVAPGPPCWPFFGSLLEIVAWGKRPIHENLAKLAHTYGPVMFFHLGSLPCLVVSSAETAEIVLKDRNLSHRATETLLYTVRHLEFDQQGFLQHCNERVNLLRKLCATELMTSHRMAAFSKARMEDVQSTIFNVSRIRQGGENLVNVQDALGSQGINTMTNMILGRRFYGFNTKAAQVLQEFAEILPDVLQLAGTLYWGDLFPALRWLDVYGIARTYRKRRLQMETAYQAIMEELKSDEPLNNAKGDILAGDDRVNDSACFLQVLLSQQKEKSNMSDTTIMATITDLIIGGSEAFGKTAEWAIIELVRKPDKMKRLQREIDSVVGQSRSVEETDFINLPYLRACVKETLRLYPTLPLLLPRETVAATTLRGYYIPPKTVVFINAWQIHRDPSYYKDPHSFEPERFLDSDLMEKVDYHFLAFGGGRRGCVGGKLGLVLTHLTLASLVHAYDWSPPPGVEPTDFKVAPTSSMVLAPKIPVYLQTTPRIDPEVYGISREKRA